MVVNRSMPPGSFIPELAYADVRAAADWLCRAFGFRERLRIGDHRVQLVFGGGAMVVVGLPAGARVGPTHGVMVAVDDVDAHYARARAAGAEVGPPPQTHSYGERQYGVVDLGGHRWTFSQSVADADPRAWGGELLAP